LAPVTECITGWTQELMISVAAGEPLPFSKLTYSAMAGPSVPDQCRRPVSQFLSLDGSSGSIPATMFASDTAPAGVQVDTGVQDGGEIPMFYDSMIAKLIVVHGTDRLDAIAKMREAPTVVIRGISSNTVSGGFAGQPKFVAGDFNIGIHR
jgi:propionyl-CoA carboxylase alpha chain